MREETHCSNMGYSFRLTARVLLYASSHRLDNTYHSLCYTSHGALAGIRNSSMGPPWRIDPTTHCTISEHSYHRATSGSLVLNVSLTHCIVSISHLSTARLCGCHLVYSLAYWFALFLWGWVWWKAECRSRNVLYYDINCHCTSTGGPTTVNSMG